MTRAEVNLTTSETPSLSPCTSLISWVSGGTQPQVGGAPRELQSPEWGSQALGVHLDALQSREEVAW